MKIIYWLFFTLLLLLIINKILSFNKTIYVLFGVFFIFILNFTYMIYLGFEFLALSFFITYIGGIFIMFLYLIIVLDVSRENIKAVEHSTGIIKTVLISICLVIFFSYGFYNSFSNEIFNSTRFLLDIDDFNILWYTPYSEFWHYLNDEITIIRNFHAYSASYIGHNTSVLFEWNSSYVQFSDIFSIGLFLYSKHHIFLIITAVFLLFAIILSCFICMYKIYDKPNNFVVQGLDTNN